MSRTLGRTGHTIPAALLAVVVLVVALAGSATAAKLITGKDIKNNTVTTKDITNSSLKGADVKDGSLGPADLSASTKNVVLIDDGSDFNLPTCDSTELGACAPIVSVAVPAGTWLVTATLTIDNFAGPATEITNLCGLRRGSATLAESRTPLAAHGDPGEAESITLQHVVTGGSTVSLRCSEMIGDSFRVNSPTLTALKVS
ncbi:MAG: hypothetical protein M3237_21480 [Actinomycetota bacterium]|nr:hypothetical protein [Actinomycetota bacterium]